MSHEIKHLTADELDAYIKERFAEFESGEELLPYADNWSIKVDLESPWAKLDPVQALAEQACIETFFDSDMKDVSSNATCVLISSAVYGYPGEIHPVAIEHTSGIVTIERLGKRKIKYYDSRWPREDETFCVCTYSGSKYYIQTGRRVQASI